MTYPRSGAAELWHRYHVYNDPDFMEAMAALPFPKHEYIGSDFHLYKDIAKRFDMKYVWIDYVRNGDGKFDPTVKKVYAEVGFKEELGILSMVVEFNPAISKQQFMDLWIKVVAMRKKHGLDMKHRTRSPAYTDLLYAINRARKEGRSYADIYLAYSAGTLDHYHKKMQQFSTAKELENYYHKYYRSNP